jgi:hypothetical protein
MAFTFRTKATGIWANFQTHCFKCGYVVTVSNGRPEHHTCERPITLADLRAALDKN